MANCPLSKRYWENTGFARRVEARQLLLFGQMVTTLYGVHSIDPWCGMQGFMPLFEIFSPVLGW